MPRASLDDLLSAGTHFGHLTRRWNPKMREYIFMEKNGIYLIDLKKTQQRLDEACNAVIDIVKNGGKVLFVGTKKQARDILKFHAQRCNQFFMTERWLGGTLTNFNTIKKNIRRLRTLEKSEIDGTFDKLTKKEVLKLEKQKEKLLKVLEGIADMVKLPDAVFVSDINKDTIAVHEARRLDIPIFAILDTNCEPDNIDYPIPGNDDSYKSIELITRVFSDAILEVETKNETKPVEEKKEPEEQMA
jgi:small subunit ribosomal protein S2